MQHCVVPVHRTIIARTSRGAGLRLEGAMGTTLTAWALASALCLNAAAQSPPAQGSPGATPVQQSQEQSPTAPAIGGMASYEGLIVQKIDFPDMPSADTNRLLDLIAQKVGSPLEREAVR